jgi:hypothetical protein
MPDPRLPINIAAMPGGFVIRMATGADLWIYTRESPIPSTASALTPEEGEALAHEIARLLTDQWGKAP